MMGRTEVNRAGMKVAGRFLICSQAMECIWSAAHFAIKARRLEQMAALGFG